MMRILLRAKFLSLFIITLLLWHYGGVWLFPHTRASEKQKAAALAGIAAPPKEFEGNRFDSLLSQLKKVVKEGATKSSSAPNKGFADISKLTKLKDSLARENDKIQAHFSQVENSLKQKELPNEILKRNEQSVRQYEAKYESLMARLESIESAQDKTTSLWGRLTGQNDKVNWDELLGETLNFLEEHTSRAREIRFDPENLPHRSLKTDKAFPPKLTREDWLKAFPKEAVSLGSAPVPSSGVRAKASVASPATTAAALEDLAQTIEVKFTPEIRQLADSLGKNPVKIYNWVRTNIEFGPTWGSIQGAQLCLETRSCNAFDTSSLLIALFRYSGIPARYQMGTIEVPIEKFKNWAGGFTNADAAASLFAGAGVPSVVRRVDQSGQVASVRLEHVWVKAFVDYAASGGALNRQSDSWVELDASFKQYFFSQGLDFESLVPVNFQGLIDQLTATATIDPVTGSVTNIDNAALTAFNSLLADQHASYVRTNLPNPTTQEVFGLEAVREQTLALLPGATPYRVLARAAETAVIPDQLRHKVTISLGDNPQAPDTFDQWRYTATLPEIAGKNVLLFYVPASPADEQLFDAVVDALGNNQILSLPSLLSLRPQLYIGDQIVATGHPLRAGSPVCLQIKFASPTISTPAIFNTMVAGESTAIGLDLQGASPAQLNTLIEKTQSVVTKIRQGDLQSITGYDLSEPILAGSILTWFYILDAANRFTSAEAGVATIRYPSAGLVFLKQNVQALFGAPVSISPEALNMDIDGDVVVSVAKDGNQAKTASLSFVQGAFGSAMEALVPSRILSTPNDQVGGTSTVEALRQANDQGIPLYTIDASNAARVIPLLQIDSSDLADIQDAVNAGSLVMISQRPVNSDGRRAMGIVVRDLQTGSTAFLISGGTNGALLYFQRAAKAARLTIQTLRPNVDASRYELIRTDDETAEAAYNALREWESIPLRPSSHPHGTPLECVKAAFVLQRVGSLLGGYGECRICDFVTINGVIPVAIDLCAVPGARDLVPLL